MSALTTKPNGYDVTSVGKILYWNSLALATGDTLATSLKKVLAVTTSKPASLTTWAATGGTITFTLAASTTGPVTVYGHY